MPKMRHIPVSQPALIGKEREYVMNCLDSSWISSNGRYIELFEVNFAEYINVKYAIACCNGTAALHVALLALGIGCGDEVIVPTFSYVATSNAVHYTGATPVLTDCELDTWNIDPNKVRELITPKTKAIIVVPLYGHPCDMDTIMAIAREYGLYVVEDAAEALGAEYRGKKCGSIADISTFSFYGNKTITTGEGGMVVTNNQAIADRVRLLKGQGMDPARRYWFPAIGYNYRMTNIQAAIGVAQMENIDKLIAKRREIAGWYQANLEHIKYITLPIEKDYALHSFWMYSILIEDEFGKSRDEVMRRLNDNDIETRPFFYPMHSMPVYYSSTSKFINSDQIAARGINLPTYYEMSMDDVSLIADSLNEILRQS